MEPAAAVVPACSRAGLFPSTAQTRGCPLAHSTSFLPISGPQNRILSSGFPALLLTEAAPAFLLFPHACFFFHTRTPPDQSSAKARGDAGLRGPGGGAVCPQPPPAAVKPHCASEAERNQNRGSACGIHRRLLGGGGGCLLAHRGPSQRSVQRGRSSCLCRGVPRQPRSWAGTLTPPSGSPARRRGRGVSAPRGMPGDLDSKAEATRGPFSLGFHGSECAPGKYSEGPSETHRCAPKPPLTSRGSA